MAFVFKLIQELFFTTASAPCASPEHVQDKFALTVSYTAVRAQPLTRVRRILTALSALVQFRDSDSSSGLVSFSSLDLDSSSSLAFGSHIQSLGPQDTVTAWVAALPRQCDEVMNELAASSSAFPLDVSSASLTSALLDWETSTQASESSRDADSVFTTTSSSVCREIRIQFGSSEPASSPPASPALSSASMFFSFPPLPEGDQDDVEEEEEEEGSVIDSLLLNRDEDDALSIQSTWAPQSDDLPAYARKSLRSSESTNDRYSFRSIYARAEPSTHVSTTPRTRTRPSHTTLQVSDWASIIWDQRTPTWRREALRKQRQAREAERSRRRGAKRSPSIA